MKSAYELAMERLEQASGPSKKLTEAQKAKIAELDKVYNAKVAELKLSYEAKFGAVTTMDEHEALQAEQADALASLEARREKEKQAVWDSEG